MEMNLHNVTDNQFTNYAKHSVTVNKKEYTNNIIVTNSAIYDLNIIKVEDLKPDDLTTVLEFKPDLVIFGTGSKIIYPNMEILNLLQSQSIGFEVMSIPALCRTYNFLISEDRKIACFLIF